MPIQMACRCGYSEQVADWSSAGKVYCPQCGLLLRKVADSGNAIEKPFLSSASIAKTAGHVETAATGPSRPCPFCGEQILAAAIKCKHCGEMFGTPDLPGTFVSADAIWSEYQELKAMRKRYSFLSFAFGLPGIFLSLLPYAIMALNRGEPSSGVIAPFVGLIGMALIGVGFIYAVKYKGWSAVWGVFALVVCWLGLLVVALLKDRNRERLVKLAAMLKMLGRDV